MGTTAEKLQAVLNSKEAIKTSLENKGLEPTDQLSTYAGLVDELENTSDATATEDSIMEGEVAYTATGRTVGKAEPGIPIVTTEGTGEVYTATVPLMTELKAGKKVTIIPHVTSTSANAKLNVNGLGEKFIRQRLSTNTGATASGYTDGWILQDKPITLMYNGTYWVTDITRPDANTIYGSTKIENGGTGATTAEAARENLGAASQTELDELKTLMQSFEDTKADIVGSGLGTALGMSTGDTWADIVADIEGVANNGAISKTITPSSSAQSYTIPKGYHSGTGKLNIKAVPTSVAIGMIKSKKINISSLTSVKTKLTRTYANGSTGDTYFYIATVDISSLNATKIVACYIDISNNRNRMIYLDDIDRFVLCSGNTSATGGYEVLANSNAAGTGLIGVNLTAKKFKFPVFENSNAVTGSLLFQYI